MTNLETYIVDSFTDKPFKGNPAGVCILDSDLSEDTMLSIAMELGLSETAFISALPKEGHYAIRYFSPKMEIPLCGHATMAASKVIFEKNENTAQIHFTTIQNLDLAIQMRGETIVMEFPIYDTVPQAAPKELLTALGIAEITNSAYNSETHILLLEIDDCEILRKLAPDFEKLTKAHDSINGVLVTSLSDQPDYDFESRYFWPWSGTNEDPVTGGTHTFLTKYWSERLNKTKMNSFQCSERTGFMEVELLSENKMTITSQAQIVLKGELRV